MATDTATSAPRETADDIREATEAPAAPATIKGDYQPPAVNVPALTAILDGEYAEVRQLVRDNLVEHESILTDAEEMGFDEFRERVKEVVQELAATGQSAMGFPEEYGGAGDIGASIAAFETLALGDLSVLVKVGVQFGLFGGAVLQLGTKRHHDRYLEPLIKGELLGCFAMSEHGHGSNVQALETVATYDAEAGEFSISTTSEQGYKDWIGNAALHGEVAVVFAQLRVAGEDHGVHAFVVPIRVDGETAPGVRIEDDGRKMGLNGVDNGKLWFDDARVPREALLNRFGDVDEDGVYSSPIESANRRFFTTIGTLVQGRVCVGGGGINAAKVAITIAVKYALRRRQFEATSEDVEDILLDYGQHQRRLLPLLARTYALHFAQEIVARETHDVFTGANTDEGDRRRLESRAAGTKALGTWHCTRTIQEGREACGGAGYLAANRFAALKADSDIFTTFEGDNTVLMQLVAKGLLTDYAGGFEDLDQLGMVRFVGGLAVETVVERTSVHKLFSALKDALPGGDAKWDEEAGLLDPDYQLAMLRFREEHMIGGVARRLKRGVDAGHNPGAVFSRAQDHVIGAAHAHMERLVLEAFVDKVRSLPEGDERTALSLLCDLHALSVIESDRAWFMEHGRLTVQRSKAVTREVNALCRRVRPLAGELVDALAVPRAMLRADDLVGTD